ncbi:MAG: 2-dehydro-3-deoxygalactonokinase [Chitinophagaceae bacterium]
MYYSIMHKTFLSCDWGTSSFRLRLIDIASGVIIAASSSGEGIAAVYALWKQTGNDENKRISFYLAVIQKHVKKIERDIAGNTDTLPVIVSGMASSSIGMFELPYTELPFLLNGEDLQYKKIKNSKEFPHDLVIITGARTGTDVMRGEETQLIGCAQKEMADHQIFIFTGTHSKHITARGGKAADTATFMTGEFFELLAQKSILSESITASAAIEDNENTTAFEQGVKDSSRQNLLHDSFMVRTNQLFKRLSKTENYFYLSGLLIGTELSQLQGKQTGGITIVGDQNLTTKYLIALQVLGFRSAITTADAAMATIQGQLVIYNRIFRNE